MKSTLIKVRLAPEEKRKFQRAAKLSGEALSAWVRKQLREAATRDIADSKREVAA